jgi:hypothetical protein
MFKLLLFVAVTAAAPAVVFDYNCTPNVVCGIVAMAAGKGMLGLSNINEYTIAGAPQLQRTSNITFTCPKGYCKNSNEACLEYPFSSTDNTNRKHVCVGVSELQTMESQLAQGYTSNNIGNGGNFHVGVSNLPATGCM